MPSVLIEVGFLSNKEEEEYLNSDKGQDEVVENIVDALERYKNQVEGGAPFLRRQCLSQRPIPFVNKGTRSTTGNDLFP